MTKYMGLSTLPYANSTYYQFQVTQKNQASGELVVQNCYFDVNTNRLKYVMVEGLNYVFESTLGLQERQYDRDEFDSFSKCPASAKKVLAQASLKNN